MPRLGRNSKMTLLEIQNVCKQYNAECLTTIDEFKEYKSQNTTLLKFKYKCGCIKQKNWASFAKNIKRNNHHCCTPRCYKEIIFKNNYDNEKNLYKCSKCNKFKELNSKNFKPEKCGIGEFRNYCRKCEQLVHVETMNNYSLEKYIKVYLLYNAERRHKERIKKGRLYENEFKLTVNDILEMKDKQKNLCAYSGKEMVWNVRGKWDQVSIDRIDSSKTYTKNNIVLVRWIANSMKNDLSFLDFKDEIKSCYNILFLKNN